MLKHLFKFAAAAMIFAGLAACQKPVVEEPEKTDPFTSISFTIGNETVDGVVADNKIKVTFFEAEDFSDVKITVALNEGFTVVVPADLNHADLAAVPTINFKNAQGKEFRFPISISSLKFAVKDISKVSLEGVEGNDFITLDGAAKTISILYNHESMNKSEMTLVFAEGALNEGITAPENCTFNFDEGRLEKDLIFKAGENDNVYTLILDVSEYATSDYRTMGFADISNEYFDPEAYPFAKVYKANETYGVPTFILQQSKAFQGGWCKENPFTWDGEFSGMEDPYTDDNFAFLGDWTADRPVYLSPINCAIYIVELDEEAVKGKIAYTDGNAIDVNSLSSFVSVGGPVAAYAKHLYDNGNYVKNQTPENASLNFRSAIGFSAEGKMSFATADMSETGAPKAMPIIPAGTEESELASYHAMAEDWNVAQFATCNAFGYRDGYAMSVKELLRNDGLGFGWEDALGYGYNGIYNSRAVIGRTWDNKIAIAICPPGTEDYARLIEPYWFDPNGYSYTQLCWICRSLGWRDCFPLATRQGADAPKYVAQLKINGKLVLAPDGDKQPAWAVSFDVK